MLPVKTLLLASATGLAFALVAAGCGGGSSAAAGPVSPTTESSTVASARVTVDLLNNTVKVTPDDSRAVFSGGAISFIADQVLNEGVPARKVLNVAMRDLSGEQAIANSTGYKVIFSNFRNLASPATSLTGTVKTSTVFGTTASTITDGSILNATAQNLKSIAYEPTSKVLYLADGSTLRMLKNDTVSTLGTYPGPIEVAPVPVCQRFPSGGVLVSSNAENKIFFVDPQGNKQKIAGTGTAGSIGGAAVTSTFTKPTGIATVQTSPNFMQAWIIDSTGAQLRLLAMHLDLTADDTVTGALGQDGVNKVAIAADQDLLYLSNGVGVVVAAQNNVGSLSLGDFAAIGTAAGAADGAGATASFLNPKGLALVDGTLYVADSGNNKVRQVARRLGASPVSAGSYWVSTLSGTGTAGFNDGTSSMTHSAPLGMAAFGSSLFVSDNGSGRLRLVQPLDSKFTVLQGSPGAVPVDLPVLANPDGYLPGVVRNPYQDNTTTTTQQNGAFVMKPWKFIVPTGTQTFDFTVTVEATAQTLATLPSVQNAGPAIAAGSPNVSVRTLAGTEPGGFSDGPGSTATFKLVRIPCSDAAGNIYVPADACIVMITPDGTAHTIAGSRASLGGSPVPALGSVAFFSTISGVTCNPEGTELFVGSETGVRRVSLVGSDRTKPDSWFVSGFIVGPSVGNADLSPVLASTASFRQANALAYANSSTIYIADNVNQDIRVLTYKGGDRDLGSSWIVSFAAGSPSGATGTTDGAGAAARFNSPSQIAVGPTGELFIADTGNNSIRVMQPSGVVTTLAGVSSPIGSGYADALGTAAKFNSPLGVAVDAAGYVYVGDQVNGLIRRISPNKLVSTVAGGPGTVGVGGVDGSGATARVFPSFLTILRGGDLGFTDGTRIRIAQRIIRN